MKRLLLLLCLIPMLIACSSDDDETTIVGTWEMVYATLSDSVNGNVIDSWDGPLTYEYFLFLKAGGVGFDYNSKRSLDETRDFEWFLHDGKITLLYSDGDKTYEVRDLTANTLVLYGYWPSGNGVVEVTQTYRRVKQ